MNRPAGSIQEQRSRRGRSGTGRDNSSRCSKGGGGIVVCFARHKPSLSRLPHINWYRHRSLPACVLTRAAHQKLLLAARRWKVKIPSDDLFTREAVSNDAANPVLLQYCCAWSKKQRRDLFPLSSNPCDQQCCRTHQANAHTGERKASPRHRRGAMSRRFLAPHASPPSWPEYKGAAADDRDAREAGHVRT